VEDEPLVRDSTARSLRMAGYRVLAARGGREALQLAAEEPTVDLLVCDVMMPGQNGREVHDALRAFRPGIRALFVSGYPDSVIQERGELAPGIEFLPKPFTTAALLARVRQVIEDR
jgi:CheY-like chemotaxis protein